MLCQKLDPTYVKIPMSHLTEHRPPVQWISIALTGLLTMMLTGLMLKKECKKRQSKQIRFMNKFAAISSLLCIISGLLYALFLAIQYFDIFCYFGVQMVWVFGVEQPVFMGMYQLSRLYYCFSQTSTPSSYGYPNWLINIMYLFGILIGLNIIIYPWILIKIPTFCGMNNKYESISNSNHNRLLIIWAMFSGFIYVFWDFMTLSLYVYKVRSIRTYKSKKRKSKHIESILNRIILLTLLYEIPYMMVSIFAMIYNQYQTINSYILFYFQTGFASIIISYSMFLMQEHNTLEYKQFLKISYKFGFYHCCCCCFKSIVIDEIYIKSTNNNTNNNNIKMDDTTYDIKELTIQTTTIQNDHINSTKHSLDINIDANNHNNRDESEFVNVSNTNKLITSSKICICCYCIFLCKLCVFVLVLVLILCYIQ